MSRNGTAARILAGVLGWFCVVLAAAAVWVFVAAQELRAPAAVIGFVALIAAWAFLHVAFTGRDPALPDFWP
jgi:hypothetical protein